MIHDSFLSNKNLFIQRHSNLCILRRPKHISYISGSYSHGDSDRDGFGYGHAYDLEDGVIRIIFLVVPFQVCRGQDCDNLAVLESCVFCYPEHSGDGGSGIDVNGCGRYEYDGEVVLVVEVVMLLSMRVVLMVEMVLRRWRRPKI